MPRNLGILHKNWNKLIHFYVRHKGKILAIFFLGTLAVISFAHLFRLTILPAGLYVDESSFGYNSALIEKTGMDEKGLRFPIYIEAFGEYKHPIYTYLTALIFKFFGISEFNLRVTSFLFYFSALFFSFILVSKIFKKNKIILFYFLLSFGFLPHFFTISRISFEVISQLSFISFALLLIYMIFVDQEIYSTINIQVISCGLILGISVYTYSTARVLSVLLLISIWIFFFKRENIKKLITLTLMFIISLIPFIVFAINNPGAMTSRFKDISYISSNIPLIKMVTIFLSNVIAYWSPNYLIKNGDSNLRHSIGYGGVIFITTFLLFLLGIIFILTNKKLLVNRFNLILLSNLLASPLAAILTSDGTPQALRSLLLGFYILIISCFGVMFICQLFPNQRKWILITCIFSYLIFEVVAYQAYYFIIYPSKSIFAMESFDLKQSLQSAINEDPQEIFILSKPDPSIYVSIKFYSYLVSNYQKIPINMSESFQPVQESCLIYNQKVEHKLDKFSIPYYELENHYELSPLEIAFKVEPPELIFKVRCFQNSN